MLFSLSQSFSNTAKQVPYTLITYAVLISITFAMFFRILQFTLPMLPLTASKVFQSQAVLAAQDASSSWYPPADTDVNDHARAMDGTGPMAKKVVPWAGAGASEQPQGWEYGEYNYCNMPHVRAEEYVKKGEEFELLFVEVIQRHHKRTPYAANTFPVENYAWNCDDAQLYQFGRPNPEHDKSSASGFWHIIDNDDASTTKVNPFTAPGFRGSCQFPQITRGGLEDSWQHGKDLYGVYHDMLHLIPDTPSADILADPKAKWHQQVRFRVTNNPITSQVAGMLLNGMFGITSAYPLSIQPKAIDSLEPSYSCPRAAAYFSNPSPPPDSPTTPSQSRFASHLHSTHPLFARLDRVSGVDPNSAQWHDNWDHYFDTLSSRLCHSMPLPCNDTLPAGENCVTQAEAEEVFRLGMWEYSHVYRDAPESLGASAAGMGVWLAEVVGHMRDVVAAIADGNVDGSGNGEERLRYMHNVAHDGSIARVLGALQVESMVWPGLGSEIVFEVYRRKEEEGGRYVEEHEGGTEIESSVSGFYLRVLWGGRVFRSSDPSLGEMDMLPLETFLAYVDELVGGRASKVKEMCGLE